MQVSQVKHIVLSGGGMLGISYIGLIKYLEEKLPNPIVKNLKSITGCSAGAFFSTLIAIGYTYTEMITIVKTMKFNEYMNINAESLINFMRLKGLETGKNIITFFKKCIKDKTGDENITFRDIKNKFNVELQIGVTNLSTSSFELINSINYPDLPVHRAISASIAIPFIFEPVIIGEDVYCDGGLLDNLPIDKIVTKINNEETNNKETNNKETNNKDIDISNEENQSKSIESILGIYLLNQINNINKDNYQSISLSHYMSEVIHAMSSEFINKKIYLNNLNNKTTEKNKIIIFKIPCDIMTFLKLKSSQEDIENIIDIAYNTSMESFTPL